MRRILLCALPALFLLAQRACADDPETMPHASFNVSYWFGPPASRTSRQTYQQIKDANFNVVFPPGSPDAALTEEDNLKILDICRSLDLRAVIFDARMPKSMGEKDAARRIDAIVEAYHNHPALLAYFIVDEPSAADFAALGEVMAYLRQRDPKHFGYINLLPTYAAPWTQLGTPTYEQHVDQFIRAVDPSIISFDHYPFLQSGDRPDYFTNLAIVRNAAVKHRRDFWTIQQLTQHYDYRHLTEPELRVQAMHTLAFGGRGMLWYTYWYPGPRNENVNDSAIGFDAAPDKTYEWIKSINGDARAIGDALSGYISWATFQTGEGAQCAAPPKTPIAFDDSARLTIGIFRSGDRPSAALVVNRDYKNAASATARLLDAALNIERFDPQERRWMPARQSGNTAVFAIQLPPGGGILLRW